MATKNPFGEPAKKSKANPFGGAETVEEEELEHGIKLEKPLESHRGFETPEEEDAEEEEIEDLYGERGEEKADAVTPRMFVDEVKALLERLDAPKAKGFGKMSIRERKLPI